MFSITSGATRVARMGPRICRKSVGVKWRSASCKMKYRAWRMSRPPVLNRRCCRLVSVQLWMARGKTSRRKRLPRLGDDPEEQPHLVWLEHRDDVRKRRKGDR